MSKHPLQTALLAAACTAAFVAPAIAQTAPASDPIAARQALMEQNGKDTKTGADMLKGAVPYDAAKAKAIFQGMNDVAAKFGGLFPKGTETGGKTEAAPAIWTKPADFKAALAKFQADTAAAATGDLSTTAAFGTAFGKVTANCKACHESLRVKKG
ncbi:cytochrome c [Polymorphobacter glacialis]|uniref:Cytochrome c n=1 Tax=Sandarakinorhabdus glacialis TaxID=1614636 RepID=A0A916ZSC6_9SPHN|nr:cytochrome c [Polymorphobacter glacialis]GGE11692.1 cytochrome c [Polymorphobacter glacialis]